MAFPHYSQMNTVSRDRDRDPSYDDHPQKKIKHDSSREQIEMDILRATANLFDFSREESLSSQPDHTNDPSEIVDHAHNNTYHSFHIAALESTSQPHQETHTMLETPKFLHESFLSQTSEQSFASINKDRSPVAMSDISSASYDEMAQVKKHQSQRLLNINQSSYMRPYSEYQIQNRADHLSSTPFPISLREPSYLKTVEDVFEDDFSQSFQSKAKKNTSMSRPDYDKNDGKATKKSRRGRPKRDPRQGWPKRPLSAYNIFFKEEREKLIENRATLLSSTFSPSQLSMKETHAQGKHGLISFSELGKIVGRKWKSLSDMQKAPYKELAELHLVQYRKDMEEHMALMCDGNGEKIESSVSPAFEDIAATVKEMSSDKSKEAGSISQSPKKRRGRPKRDPKEGWPKRPLSAYNIFFKQERIRLLKSDPSFNPNLHIAGNTKKSQHEALDGNACTQNAKSNKELVRTIASNWKQLSQEHREYYAKTAEVYMTKYRKEMEIFQEKRQQSINSG